MLEQVLSIFVYHRVYTHDDVIQAYTKVMNDFPALGKDWSEETARAFNNIFNECDFESRSRMLRGLSANAGNAIIGKKIVGVYRNTLKKIRDKKENKEAAQPFVELLSELNELFPVA